MANLQFFFATSKQSGCFEMLFNLLAIIHVLHLYAMAG